MTQVYNFSAGPAMIPQVVLDKAQQELKNWDNLGVSVMEVSHRGKAFMALAEQSDKDLRSLYNVPDNYSILFLQGGAKGQFSAIPMNLNLGKGKALYLTSGHWSKMAAEEASKYTQVTEINILHPDTDKLEVGNLDFSDIADQYDYVHYCPNETISGVEIFDVPKVSNAVLVADMSSTILSRKIDISQFGVIYAGAQKNLGPSGITIVIVRNDLVGRAKPITPQIWDYAIQQKSDSMINTPPTFAWYLCSLVFKHLLEQGGIENIEEKNKAKAQKLYEFIDSSQLFSNKVAIKNRSRMNVTFVTGSEELDSIFVEEARKANLQALKGHKVSGGMRASIYNAMPMEGVKALIEFMKKFEAQHSE